MVGMSKINLIILNNDFKKPFKISFKRYIVEFLGYIPAPFIRFVFENVQFFRLYLYQVQGPSQIEQL